MACDCSFSAELCACKWIWSHPHDCSCQADLFLKFRILNKQFEFTLTGKNSHIHTQYTCICIYQGRVRRGDLRGLSPLRRPRLSPPPPAGWDTPPHRTQTPPTAPPSPSRAVPSVSPRPPGVASIPWGWGGEGEMCSVWSGVRPAVSEPSSPGPCSALHHCVLPDWERQQHHYFTFERCTKFPT